MTSTLFRFSCPPPVWAGMWLLFAGLMGASLLIGRALNLAWIVLALAALFAVICPHAPPPPSHALSSGDALHRRAIRWIGWAAALGLALKLGAQVYWGTVGSDLAMELNSLVVVGAAWALTVRRRPDPSGKCALYWAAWGAAAVAIYQSHQFANLHVESALPTNAVNWAAAQGLLMVVLLVGVVDRTSSLSVRWVAGMGLLCLTLALFISARRGTYFALLWTLLVLGRQAWQGIKRGGASRRQAILATGVAVVVWAAVALTPLMADSIGRLVSARSEFVHAVDHGASQTAAVSSVASRMFLAMEGMASVAQSPWLGIGPAGHDALLKDLMPTTVAYVFHFHNEYVDIGVTYGVLGLVSILCVPLTLLFAAWQLRAAMPVQALGMSGFALAHLVSGLSNTNTFHNFYQTLFAICLVLTLLVWPDGAGQAGDNIGAAPRG